AVSAVSTLETVVDANKARKNIK
ncbi:MAG: hypothetical protein RI903_1395, partial [Bacteroidota bacterium]